MGFKRAGTSFPRTIDITDEKGMTFEGHYIQTKTIHSDKLTGGSALVHEFLLPETGELVSIWGKGQLNKKLEEVALTGKSVLTRITYNGTEKFKMGKKTVEAHQFDVEYDVDNVAARG